MKLRVLFATALLSALFAATASATPIAGTFNIAGVLTITSGGITWTQDSPPFTADKASIGPGGTGSFGSLTGTTATIHDLNYAVDPVGVSFAAQPFLGFDSGLAAGFPILDINFIFAGIYGTTQCGTLPATVGQTCSPANSAFNLVNNPPPAPIGPQATLTFVVSGVTSDGLATWHGNFTSQFTVPYQTVLSQLGSIGSVTNTYSATFTVTPTTVAAVPEPASLLLLGSGLSGLAARNWRRKRLTSAKA